MTLKEISLKAIREIYTKAIGFPTDRSIDFSRVQYADKKANEFLYYQIKKAIESKKGLAICKLGTIELGSIVSYLINGGGGKISILRLSQFH